MLQHLRSLPRQQRGATSREFSLVAGLIASAVISYLDTATATIAHLLKSLASIL